MPSKVLLTALILAATLTNVNSVSAFSVQLATLQNKRTTLSRTLSPSDSALLLRGGSVPTNTALKMSAAAATTPAPSTKKMRIEAFDSMRFFLSVCIVLGHFIRFANPSPFWLRFFSQHNVIVGAFFALSGYVTAYTSTENAKAAASPKLLTTPKQEWILSRIFGFYPLYMIVLILFSPIFLYADVHYNGWGIAALNGLLSSTLTQAWFPMHAEVWNAPTWFLSALAFSTMILPFALPVLAAYSKTSLVRSGMCLFAISLLPKLGYVYDFPSAWKLPEGMLSNPNKQLPNLAVFNTLRFSPLYLVSEVLLGAIACRLVMMDGADDKVKPRQTNWLSTTIPATAMITILALRAAKIWPDISDLLIRSISFVPLFLRFLMAVHRQTISGRFDPLVRVLKSKWLVAAGNLSFPIFIVHGPIGQVFYKKLIATKLFGHVLMGPNIFALYLATTLASAFLLQKLVVENTAVNGWSKSTVRKLTTWM